ncbi:DUF362 domain-containing protein [Rugosimonospora africana]|uniref:DUF362 domain-containing protein n=1 Tax=Rugosimonospora africana TaxID=556532 RepID=A0A8J3R1H6_9ACTN|nr:DUF362 domain-containing protein [Rugosimonospora africana]GIH19640.1 hypothetical protein Raf01_78120 [Rugosimonospora africana]
MTAGMLPERVYSLPAQIDAVSREATLLRRFRDLLDELAPERAFGDRDKIAIKLHVGGPDSYTTVHPQFVRALVDRFATRQNFLYVVDEHRAVRTAGQRGYNQEALGAPVYPISGVVDRYLEERPVTDSPYFDTIKVAGMVAHADGLIVVSHVKGHASCGFGAAIKNIGIGCVAQETRNHIHVFEGHDNWRQDVVEAADIPHEALAEGIDQGRFFSHALARSAQEVLRHFDPAKVLCLNVALNVHPYCDCWGLSSPAFVPDIGLFFGNDPADVDEASLRAVEDAPFVHEALPAFLKPRLGSAGEPAPGQRLRLMHGKNPWYAVEEFRRLRGAPPAHPDEE